MDRWLEREKSRAEHKTEDAEDIYNGDFSLLGICQCQVQWSFEVAGTVKIRGFDTFSRCKSREGVYRVSYGSTLKLSGRRRLYGVYIRYVKRYGACH